MPIDKIDFKSLPDIEKSIKLTLRREKVRTLMEDLGSWEKVLEAAKTKTNSLKQELEALQLKYRLQAFRLGDFCFAAREMPGKKTLSKIKLIENGVKVSVIEASMAEGKPYMERRFKDLGKPNQKEEDSE